MKPKDSIWNCISGITYKSPEHAVYYLKGNPLLRPNATHTCPGNWHRQLNHWVSESQQCDDELESSTLETIMSKSDENSLCMTRGNLPMMVIGPRYTNLKSKPLEYRC